MSIKVTEIKQLAWHFSNSSLIFYLADIDHEAILSHHHAITTFPRISV
jgi:hypothetical protein